MRRLRVIIYGGLVLAWASFALWQYGNFRQQRDLIEESLRNQSRSIMTAMVGGIRSHRRLGRFFEAQLKGMLEELAKSEDVVFVAIRTSAGQEVFSAGDEESAPGAGNGGVNQDGDPAYFRLIESFHLASEQESVQDAEGGGRGPGLGGPWGAGHGRGPGARRWGQEPLREEGPFAAGGSFTAQLVLDRSRANELLQRVTWSHLLAVLAAGFVALSIGLIWRVTMNLADARGRARVYETEMRHLRELGQAAAGLAHETRNPLGLIRGWTQRLADTAVADSERHEHSRAVIEECDRVTARINQFLAFARPYEPKRQPVDMASLLDELAAIMQPDLETRGLSLDCQVMPECGTLLADFELLRQVIFNLVQNAVSFSPAEGTIDVSVKGQGRGRAVLEVADRGPGVEDDKIESLFTPYYTTRPEGTGLGLAIVRHISTLHNWDVAYCQRPGGGAVFGIGRIHVADKSDDCDRG